jgi:hypothetical protein
VILAGLMRRTRVVTGVSDRLEVPTVSAPPNPHCGGSQNSGFFSQAGRCESVIPVIHAAGPCPIRFPPLQVATARISLNASRLRHERNFGTD